MNLVNKLLKQPTYLVFFKNRYSSKVYVYSDTRYVPNGILTTTLERKRAKQFRSFKEALEQLNKLQNKNEPGIERY